MNFSILYKIFHPLKIKTCKITELFKINKIIFGSGGSDNIIFDAYYKKNKVIIKIIPDLIYLNVKKKPDYAELEIKFYIFFTKKYVLTNKTPHIVGIYNYHLCKNINKLIEGIYPKKITCPTYENNLLNEHQITFEKQKLCDLLSKFNMGLINPKFNVLFLEYCPIELKNIIHNCMQDINTANKDNIKISINRFINILNRLLFQIIFTLAIIKNDYPGFMHGDLFIRNILVSYETTYHDNEYVAYHYKQKIFYLSANGLYAKINDFGTTIIVNVLEPNVYKIDKLMEKIEHKNPFHLKSDIFNLLHDIYDGQNLGSISIKEYERIYKLKHSRMVPITNFMNKFIQTNIIDKINIKNRELLNETWNIDQIKILEKSIQTPDQYLSKTIFESYQQLPEDGIIIKRFNAP